MTRKQDDTPEQHEFRDALCKGALIGAALLVLIIPPLKMSRQEQAPPARPPVAATAPAPAPATQAPAVAQAPAAPQPRAPEDVPAAPGLRLADFGKATPSREVRLVADWAVHTRNYGARSFVVVDKKLARVWVFDPQGRLKAHAPALLGEGIGDDTAPGVANKPLSQLKLSEKTTPAGRFIAEWGSNLSGEDVVWVDYDAAVSMHRVRVVKPSERRFARLASATYADNRISNGCINLPVKFYENVLQPTVRTTGAVIYVIPEVRDLHQVLGAWDVTAPTNLAQKN